MPEPSAGYTDAQNLVAVWTAIRTLYGEHGAKRVAEEIRRTRREQRLRKALSFAVSCIKAGEPWTEHCREIIEGALTD